MSVPVSPVIGTREYSAKQQGGTYPVPDRGMAAQLPHVVALLVAEKLATTDELRPNWCVARDAAALACAGLPAMAAILWDALEPPALREARWRNHTSRRVALTPPQGARVVDLKALCRTAGVKLTGLKADLQARLQEVLSSIPTQTYRCPLSPERVMQLYRARVRELRDKEAKKLWFLDDEELAVLRRRYNGKLIACEALELARALCGDDLGVLRRRGETVDQRRRERKAAKDRRRLELVVALNERGCQLREDSRLCKAYIEDGEGDLEDIATKMQEMAFFHKHTRYSEMFGWLVEHYRSEREWWERDEVSAQAKVLALRDWAATYPGGRHAACRAPELPPSLRRMV
jgi:hypothetical protein